MTQPEHHLRDGQEQFFDVSLHAQEIPQLASLLLTYTKAGSFIKGKIVLGEGGFATVTKGLHVNTDKFVAIKSSPSIQYDQPLSLKEAICLSTLEKEEEPCTPQFIAYIEKPTNVGVPTAHLIMSLTENPKLSDRIKQSRETGSPIPLNETVSIIQSLARILDRVHDKHGIQHRDPVPDNITIDDNGDLMLLDWGIADTVYTSIPGQFVGTLRYSAPELVSGSDNYTPQSAVYTLGVILHEMITGEWTHGIIPNRTSKLSKTQISNIKYLILDIRARQLKSYPQVKQHIPEQVIECLQSIQNTSLSKEPSSRYPTPTEYALALSQLITS
jgi:serine/threonine-protein kinase